MIEAARSDPPAFDMIVLDELNIVLRYDYLPIEEVLEVLANRPPDLHVVVTGRNAKEPFDRGGRPGDRDDHGQAPVPRRREGAEGDRVLNHGRRPRPSPMRPGTPVLMLQGTGSDVGKSLLSVGLCRAFARRGLKVRPFKPQNMSNNAAVTADGGEIGRAQALQARACGVAPSVDMNPRAVEAARVRSARKSLFREESLATHGRPSTTASSRPCCRRFWRAFDRLAMGADLVVVEGAGSASEVNLRGRRHRQHGLRRGGRRAGDPGRRHRTGAASSRPSSGTALLLPAPERARLKGYVINRFRGDVSLFGGAVEILRERSGLDSFGIVPFFAGAARLPAEDGMAVDRYATGGDDRPIKVAVPALPRISNFDDLDPAARGAGRDRRHGASGRGHPRRLRSRHPARIQRRPCPTGGAAAGKVRQHRPRCPICGRGGTCWACAAATRCSARTIADPDGIEGPAGDRRGVGTAGGRHRPDRRQAVVEVEGACRLDRQAVRGYEMHVGETSGPATAAPLLDLAGRARRDRAAGRRRSPRTAG